LVKEDIVRRRKKKVFGEGRGGVFRGSRSSWLLGLLFCLMIDDVVFHLRIGSVSDDDDGDDDDGF